MRITDLNDAGKIIYSTMRKRFIKYNYVHHSVLIPLANAISKEIISLIDQHYNNERKSGLVSVKDCPQLSQYKIRQEHDECCLMCNGTGRIVLELSVNEALEWLKAMVKYHFPPYENAISERIEVKED